MGLALDLDHNYPVKISINDKLFHNHESLGCNKGLHRRNKLLSMIISIDNSIKSTTTSVRKCVSIHEKFSCRQQNKDRDLVKEVSILETL